MKDQLYLLEPGFMNATLGPLYCGDSAPVEGLLSFFPKLRQNIDVHYIAFQKPRATLVEALGETHQSAPVLIIDDAVEIKDAGIAYDVANGKRFIASEAAIRRYLSTQYNFPTAG
jgi:hypothetical protein